MTFSRKYRVFFVCISCTTACCSGTNLDGVRQGWSSGGYYCRSPLCIHLYKQHSRTLRSAAAALSTEELGDLAGDSTSRSEAELNEVKVRASL